MNLPKRAPVSDNNCLRTSSLTIEQHARREQPFLNVNPVPLSAGAKFHMKVHPYYLQLVQKTLRRRRTFFFLGCDGQSDVMGWTLCRKQAKPS